MGGGESIDEKEEREDGGGDDMVVVVVFFWATRFVGGKDFCLSNAGRGFFLIDWIGLDEVLRLPIILLSFPSFSPYLSPLL